MATSFIVLEVVLVKNRRFSVPPLMRDPSFRRYWTGRSLSLLGGQITMLAFPLTAVLVLKVGAVGMALLTAVGALPSLLISLHAGAWVDGRGHRRQVMIVADLVRAILLALIPTAWLLGYLSLWVLIAIWLTFGVFSVLFRVASSAIFVAVVPEEDYGEASRLLSQSRAAGFLIGPALAGWLIGALSAPLALLADAVSFVASAVTLMAIHPPEPEGDAASRGRLLVGLRFIRASTILKPLAASQLTHSVFRAAFMTLYILYGTRELGITPGQWGLILGPSSGLALIGSSLTVPLMRRIGLGRTLVLGSIIRAVPLLAIPLAGGPHALVVGVLFLAEGLGGAGSMMAEITDNTIRAAAVGPQIRARVSGVFSMAGSGMIPVGASLAAVLVWLVGIHVAMYTVTMGMVAAVPWLLVPPVYGLFQARDLTIGLDA